MASSEGRIRTPADENRRRPSFLRPIRENQSLPLPGMRGFPEASSTRHGPCGSTAGHLRCMQVLVSDESRRDGTEPHPSERRIGPAAIEGVRDTRRLLPILASLLVLLSLAKEQPVRVDAGDFDEEEDNLAGDCHAGFVIHPGPERDRQGIGQELAAMVAVQVFPNFAEPSGQAILGPLNQVSLLPRAPCPCLDGSKTPQRRMPRILPHRDGPETGDARCHQSEVIRLGPGRISRPG